VIAAFVMGCRPTTVGAKVCDSVAVMPPLATIGVTEYPLMVTVPVSPPAKVKPVLAVSTTVAVYTVLPWNELWVGLHDTAPIMKLPMPLAIVLGVAPVTGVLTAIAAFVMGITWWPGPTTVTVAVPLLARSNVEIALTASDVAVSLTATARRPSPEIAVPETPPSTSHVTVVGGLLVPKTVAVKYWLSPLTTLAVAGLTVTLVTVGSGVIVGVFAVGHPVIETPIIVTRAIIPNSLAFFIIKSSFFAYAPPSFSLGEAYMRYRI